MDRLASWLTFLRGIRYHVMFVHLVGCLDAECGGGIEYSSRSQTHISLLASETDRPNRTQTVMIMPIIFLSCSVDGWTIAVLSPELDPQRLPPPAPQPLSRASVMSIPASKHITIACITVAKIMFKWEGRTHAPMAEIVLHGEPVRALAVVKPHACRYAIMDLTDDRNHLPRQAKAG